MYCVKKIFKNRRIIPILLCTSTFFLSTLLPSNVNAQEKMPVESTLLSRKNVSKIVDNSEAVVVTNLDQFALELSKDTKKSEIKKLSKKNKLFSNSKRSGTGNEVYRIAADKKIAKMDKPEKGSFIELTFDLLKNDSLIKIDYFSEDKMSEAFWDTENEYTMLDYNNPAVPEPFSIKSIKDFIEYVPKIPMEQNKLEELFCKVSKKTTKKDIMDFIDKNDLSYNPRGAGNYEIISYSSKVADKYGLDGSHLIVDFQDDKLARLIYVDYVADYYEGVQAAFYTKDYPYEDYDGFYLVGDNGTPKKMKDGHSVINEIWKLRTKEA